jgi:hypothetical protein
MARHPEGDHPLTPAERQQRHRAKLQEGATEADYALALSILRQRVGILQRTLEQAQGIVDGLVEALGLSEDAGGELP